jgi:hypothetical protein
VTGGRNLRHVRFSLGLNHQGPGGFSFVSLSLHVPKQVTEQALGLSVTFIALVVTVLLLWFDGYLA